MNSEHKLEGNYNPKEFEDELYEGWERKGYFKPDREEIKKGKEKGKKPFSIVMPPPNITGKLHMGHALDETIQDALTRFKRMQGYNTLWLPGTDHASIATEAKIVASMKEAGITKEDIGRDGFLERAWDWKKEYGGEICKQLRKLGSSCDWSRERFTMDEGLSDAVMEVFVKMYNEGLIYKGTRMINWCPNCNTSISDAEVEHEEVPTHLWYIKYKIKGEEDNYLTVATTRPETMLGDTGVAVNPTDERYKDFVGKTAILPIMNKEIPIIADEFVSKEFGTGAVKLTPAHDPNDYQAALTHGLEIIEVFDENFKMGNLHPDFAGMDLMKAREAIVERLKENGDLLKIEDYNHEVGKCYRCNSIIEPKISEQWFVKMKPLAEPAIEAVKTGKTKFIPKRYEKTYFNWMENIQDWCISRQLWWGHRIPAYYCDDCGHMMVNKEQPLRCEKCDSLNIHQDPDTLDTWFSSALWPFSTLGWPNETDDLKYFFPTNVLVTGYDIIFFWVARMIFSSLKHMNEVPFEDVLIHGIVRDAQGRKMSKSLGNGVDPLEVINQYGTDSLRISLIMGISAGNDIRYIPEKLESSSNFANKLWNAAKFVLMQIENYEKAIEDKKETKYTNIEEFEKYLKQSELPDNISIEDKWIISKQNSLIKDITRLMEKYDMGVATQKIYDFIWNEFCDWYIEMVKPRFFSEKCDSKDSALWTLNYVLENSLKLLHPIMPFITEKIYLNLYNNDESIMISSWPKYSKKLDFSKEEEDIEKIKEVIVGIRNARAKINVAPSKKSKLIISTDKEGEEAIKKARLFFEKLGFAEKSLINEKATDEELKNSVSVITHSMKVYIPLAGIVDFEEEKKRLHEEIKKLEGELKRSASILSNKGFLAKAPEAKIEEEKSKKEKYETMLKTAKEELEKIK